MYRPVLDAVSGSLALTALAAMLPLLTLFILLGVLKMTAWKAALISLAISLAVAIFAYSMPVGHALLATTEGAAFGFFPILFIVISAIWIYNMTVTTGYSDVLRRSFAKISDDKRIQAVIVAFCFGGLLEALAGFGTPVAITSVMLMGLGFKPIKAAVVALLANTAPVAFGALAIPIITLAKVSNPSPPIPGWEQHLASIVGRQTPLLALFVPMCLVFVIDRWKGVKETLPATLTCGIVFAVSQFVFSNYISFPLTDIASALLGAASIVVVLRFWQPAEAYVESVDADEIARAASKPALGGATVGGSGSTGAHQLTLAEEYAAEDKGKHDSSAEVFKAYAPYLIIVLVFSLAALITPLKTWLASTTFSFQWPGLDLLTAGGKPSSIPKFTVNWLAGGGTLLLISGILSIPVIGIPVPKAVKAYFSTYVQLKWAIITVMSVLGLAYVMNASGQTATLGLWLAGAGAAFALLSPILGWLGVAVTGSDTSSNALFGALQYSAAGKAGLDPALMVAANSSGGVLGKMVSPQNLAIAAAAVGLSGKEGDIFRKVITWSLGLLVIMMVIVFLQSNILAFMLPNLP
ncbi:MAG TPA: L-lactate permease [Dermatophilaceae bacterium]